MEEPKMEFMYAAAGVKDEPTDKSVQAFAALQLISVSCHGILNTLLIKPAPKKDKDGNDMFAWFDELNSKLDDAKIAAKDWIDNIVVPIQSGIPSSIINYSNQFRASTDFILELCEKNPDMKKGDDAFNKVNNILQALIDTIDNDILAPIADSETKLKIWGGTLQTAHNNLSGKVSLIQNAESDLATDIERINKSIDALNSQINSEQSLISLGGGLVGGGVFIALIGIVLCASGVGAVAGGIVIGTGAAMVVGGAVTWGVIQGKINNQYNEIANDRKDISADKQLLVSLKGLESGTTSAVNNMTIALTALDQVKTMWTGLKNVIRDTVTKLNDAENSATAIMKEVFTTTAQKQWADADTMAQSLLGVNIKVEDKGKVGDEIAA
jgi:hypothetical protein